jgi:hypothetical protein
MTYCGILVDYFFEPLAKAIAQIPKNQKKETIFTPF